MHAPLDNSGLAHQGSPAPGPGQVKQAQMRALAVQEWKQNRAALAAAFSDLPASLDDLSARAHFLSGIVNLLSSNYGEELLDPMASETLDWLQGVADELGVDHPQRHELLLHLDRHRGQLLGRLHLKGESEEWYALTPAPAEPTAEPEEQAAPPSSSPATPRPRRRPALVAKRTEPDSPPAPEEQGPAPAPMRLPLVPLWDRELAPDLRQLMQAAEGQVWESVLSIGHKLKGTLGQLGWPELSSVCHLIEEAAKGARPNGGVHYPPQYIPHLCQVLMVACEAACDGNEDHAIEQAAFAPRVVAHWLAGQPLGLPAETKPAMAPGFLAPATPSASRLPAVSTRDLQVDPAIVESVLGLLHASVHQRVAQEGLIGNLKEPVDQLRRQREVLQNLKEAVRSFEHSGSGKAEAASASGLTDLFRLQPITSLGEVASKLDEVISNLSTIGDQQESIRQALTKGSRGLRRTMDEARERVGGLRLESLEDAMVAAAQAVAHASSARGRRVRVETAGGNTRVETKVLIGLKTILRYLASNAVAHGIETEGERVASGKPREGTVTITAETLPAEPKNPTPRVRVTVRDDGRGIDQPAVIAKARRLGIGEPAEGWGLQHIIDLLTTKGFSTSDSVDGVAGRGEGLSDCLRCVQALNGKMECATRPGAHTTWEICVPVSVSYSEVMPIQLGGQEFAIPVQYVRRSLNVRPEAIIISADNLGVPPAWRDEKSGRLAPVLDLPAYFGYEPVRSVDGGRNALLLEVGGRPYLALIDGTGARRSALLHALDPLAKNPTHPYWSGVTVSSDGTAMLVLDPDALATSMLAMSRLPTRPAGARARMRPQILAVDDSIAIQNALRTFITDLGCDAVIAQDGRQALDLFKRVDPPFAMIFTDLEMPRLNGFEFIREVRKLNQSVPIVVITSRNTLEHRDDAKEVGANDYLSKPVSCSSVAALLQQYLPPTVETVTQPSS